MRLGFAVKPLARTELRSHDSRRWQNSPHLSVSLAYLRDIFAYLNCAGISMYRMSSDLAPYSTHPDLPQFHDQLAQCLPDLAEIGRLARQLSLRLSVHLAQHVVLNTPDPALAARSRAELVQQAAILDALDLGPESVLITHLGGIYGDRDLARQHFVENFLTLPEAVRRRLVLENDDGRFGVVDVLWVHACTRIRVVFDNLHHRLNNPEHLPVRDALSACLATWPPGVRPKIHFSTPRTDWLVEQRVAGDTPHVRRAHWTYHSDYVNPFEFIDFLQTTEGLPDFDVMLEARAKDLALLQLKQDLARFAPELAARLEPAAACAPGAGNDALATPNEVEDPVSGLAA
jgi:UV DNA damage endonuclease